MKTIFASCLASLIFALSLNAQTAPLTAGTPIPLTGTGGYDFIQADAAGDRLLLGHEGNHSFDVFDLKTHQLTVVPTGTSQNAATDVKRHFYYVSGNDPGRMVIVDSGTLSPSPVRSRCPTIATSSATTPKPAWSTSAMTRPPSNG